MSDGKFDAALRDSVTEALEDMFFVHDLGEGGGMPGSGPELMARVDFTGAPSGWLTLRAGMQSARSLAADFLGEDVEALADEQASEVFAELANIVCGAVLTRTESSSVFKLAPPRLLSPEEGMPAEGGSKYVVTLANGPLTVFLKTEVAACSKTEKSAS
jgi:CheY-specific phosphatase CheX